MGCQACQQKPQMKYRKGLWSPEEDQKLRDFMLCDGHGCWSTRAVKARLQRKGKSCRLRWMNHLRPGLKHCAFSTEEEETVVSLHATLGNQWSRMAQHLPGRTDNEVKNYWNTYLRKKQFLRTGGAKRQDDAPPRPPEPPEMAKDDPSSSNHQAEPEEHRGKIMFVDWLDSAGASLMTEPAPPRAGACDGRRDLMSHHHDQGPVPVGGGAVGSLRGLAAGDGAVQGAGFWDLPSVSEFLESNYGEA